MFFLRHSDICVKLLFWTLNEQSRALLTLSEWWWPICQRLYRM